MEPFRFIVLTIIHLLSLSLSAQLHDIVLPEPDEKNKKWTKSLPLEKLKLYISADYKVFLEKERLIYWDEIVPEILKLDRNAGIANVYLSKVAFYVNKDVKYAFVDRIKEEVSRLPKKFLLYKTGQENDLHFETERVHGTVKPKLIPELLKKRDNQVDTTFHLKRIIIPERYPTSPPDKFHFWNKLQNCLYDMDTMKINKTLKKFPHTKITLLPNNSFQHKEKSYNLNEIRILEDLLKNGAIIFVGFHEDLQYSDYIKYLQEKKRLMDAKNNDINAPGIFIEISYGLQKKLNELRYQF